MPPTSQAPTKAPELLRELGVGQASAIVVGTIIGSGIFLVPAEMMQAVGSARLVYLAWIVGGLLSLAGAITYAELGAMKPQAGGEYVYIRDAYGPLTAFLYAWTWFIVAKPGSVATIATGIVRILGTFPALAFFSDTAFSSPMKLTYGQLVAIAAAILITWLNYVGVKRAGEFQLVFTVLKIVMIVGVAIVGFTAASGTWRNFSTHFAGTTGGVAGFMAALVAALWAYDGWMDLTFAGSEIIEPQKNIPRALVGGTMTVGVIYLLANAVYFRVLPMEAVASAQNAASEAVRVFAGARAAAWITAAMVLSAFTTLNSSVLTGSRVPFAMARDGLFFQVANGIHSRYRTPAGAIVFQASISCLMVLTGQFEDLFSLFIFAQWIFYGLSVASVYGSRHKEPDLVRPYRAWGYPVVPAIFVAGAFALTVNLFIQRPIRSSIGLLLILAGLPFYRYWTQGLATNA